MSLLATDVTNYRLASVPHTANRTLNRHHPGRCPFDNEINKPSASKDLRVRDIALATNTFYQP